MQFSKRSKCDDRNPVWIKAKVGTTEIYAFWCFDIQVKWERMETIDFKAKGDNLRALKLKSLAC